MSYLASKGPWKAPFSLWPLPVSQTGSALPHARQGALQVIPTGCAKDELALDQVTWLSLCVLIS